MVHRTKENSDKPDTGSCRNNQRERTRNRSAFDFLNAVQPYSGEYYYNCVIQKKKVSFEAIEEVL